MTFSYHQKYLLKRTDIFKSFELVDLSNDQIKESQLCCKLAGFLVKKDENWLKDELKNLDVDEDDVKKMLKYLK